MKTKPPFSEILEPIASRALADTDAPAPIRAAFAQQLERRLAGVLSQCLYLVFTAHRMSWQIFHGTRRGCYQGFIREVQHEGLDAALGRYPVAVEAIGMLSQQARDFAEHFASHLAEGGKAISSLTQTGASLNLKITPGWSDPHHGGRTVIELVGNDGARVFYKPRSLSVDRVWREGLLRINRYLTLPLMAPKVIDCGDHGWVEAIAEITSVTREHADAFYWRYGATLCLMWLLDGVDFHRDNVIPHRDQPVVVDAEGLLHPRGRGQRRSLSQTGIVPRRGQSVDVSALGSLDEQQWLRTIRWENPGTDDLEMLFTPSVVPAARHLPVHRGKLVTPQACEAQIIGGFHDMADAALRDRAAVDHWRAELVETRRRTIHRATVYYEHMLREAARPASMASPRAWQASVVRWQRQRMTAELQADERRQLAAWDVPAFESSNLRPTPAPWDGLMRRNHELSRLLFPR